MILDQLAAASRARAEREKEMISLETMRERAEILTEEERLFGPCLLKERHPVLQRYLLREEALRKSLTERLKEADGARAGERRNTIEEEMRHIRAALSYYEM